MRHHRLLAVVFSTVCLVAVVPLASAQTDQINTRTDYPVDWYFTPTDYPCLSETIHVTGSYEEHLHVVFLPNGGYSYQAIQTTKDTTAVGMTTGKTYSYSGPMSWTESGSTDAPWINWYSLEITFHNLNHYVGPGKLGDLFFRTLWHITLDPTTGDVKVEVFKDDVLCR